MKLAGIFQDLEHLYDFQSEAQILHRQAFIAINIPCKFGEDIFLNERDIKVYVKRDERTHVRKAFHNRLRPLAGDNRGRMNQTALSICRSLA